MKRVCIASVATILMGTAVVKADEKVDFVKQIQPILVESCGKCHGEKSAQGKLRLHTVEVIQEKIKAKPEEFLVAGKPEKSSLLQRLLLPKDDTKRMPKKADPLPKEKIDLIEKWIKEGATMPAVAAAATPKPTAEKKEEGPPVKKLPEVAAAPKKAIDQLTAAGAQVMPLCAGSNLLWVSFAHRDKPVGDEDLTLLADVAEQIDTLNISESKATAAGLAPLAKLKNMSKLHLEKSAVTDEGLAHLAGLANLEYLNLYGTGISDAGLKHLSSLKQLKNLYLWQTKASFDVAMGLEKETPGLSVDLGYNHPMVAKLRLTKSLEAAKAQAEAAKADLTKAEQQLDSAKKSSESAAARVTEIEKELKALESPATADAGKKDGDQKEGDKKDNGKKDADKDKDKTAAAPKDEKK
jgi:hypothetical protein